MTRPLTERDAEALKLFQHRNRLLTSIREHSLLDPAAQSYSYIFQRCCDILTDAFHCNGVWAGDIDKEKGNLNLFATSPPAPPINSSTRNSLAHLLVKNFKGDLDSFTTPLLLQLDEIESPQPKDCGLHCMVWPVCYQHRTYGFVVMYCREQMNRCGIQNDFIRHVIDDIALALFSQDTTLKLKAERDFSKEIIDSIQALMVSISPCGTILSFNKRAEHITGYKEHEILQKYWVDVMISPHKRREFQQFFSETLKGAQANINFTAPLLTKDGTERFISWHGSIRHNIDQGRIGLIMLGIDETKSLAADQQLNMFTARWEKIFIAIQDPALVVSNDYKILEANPATCAAAKKHRTDVIGKNICKILHGGHSSGNQCPVEQLIGHQQTRISETDLHGLHGTYMLTVSPLVEENGEINATLLVARNLTAEEVLKAEAIRAAQLAEIGELASGVAHEINNPINGIINYAQIILDAPGDPEANEHLHNIISEGKRIACIISKLLDFARRREEILAPSAIKNIIANSLQLVNHLLKKEGITCSVDLADSLPPLMCNEQQLQQVVLNMISNARYALNKKYPQPCPEKRLEIKGKLHKQNTITSIRLTFTDYGVGIKPEVLDRLFDPFFSTKPKGEGTGLGLSISHGLIRDHGGYIRVQSKVGEWTRFIIDLPIHAQKGTS